MDASKSLSSHDGAVSEMDQLLETLRKEGAQRRKNTRWFRFTLAAIFVLILIELAAGYSKGKSVDFADLLIYGSLLGGSCAYGLTPSLRNAVKQAANLKDKRLLGGMIEALDSGDPKLKETLEEACAGLLERVTPEDLGLLDDYQMDRLVEAVRISANVRFRKAAIRALGSIGTNRTLQTLEVLLSDPRITHPRRAGIEPHARQAMAELRIRLAKERLFCLESKSPRH